MNARLLFVGERRSQTAVRMGVTWLDGRLCAATLHAALRALGIDPTDPERVRFINLWEDELVDSKLVPKQQVLACLPGLVATGWVLVGLGLKVQRSLAHQGLPHVKLAHPAARGAIRKTAVYQAHVAAVLAGAQR